MSNLDKLRDLFETTQINYLSRFLAKDTNLHGWVIAETDYLGDSADLKHRVYAILNGHPHRNPCEHGNRPTFESTSTGYKQFCGNINRCACYRSFKQASMQEICSQRTPEEKTAIVEKAKQTFLKNHGVDNPSKNSSIKQRRIATNLARYGTENPMKNFTVQQKVKMSLNQRYQRDSYPQRHLSDSQLELLQSKEQLLAIVKQATLTSAAAHLGVDRNTVVRYATIHDIVNQAVQLGPTDLEEKVKCLLDAHQVNYVYRTRHVIAPMELDFYLPDHNVAIEVGALYWHSYSRCPDKNYHFRKWRRCREQGINLYTWFNDDIRDHWPVIESKIQYLAGIPKPRIGARQCNLQQITYQQARPLLEANHIQGGVNGQQYILGAYYGDQLMGVMGFAQRKHYLELTRFATNLSNTYPGLFSRMLKHSINDLGYVGDVVSFSDNAHSNGAVYQANGFEIDKILGPAYWYTSDYQTRHNRQNFMKSKIASRFGVDMSNKTEWQAMRELGWDRIWDAGKIRWKRSFPDATPPLNIGTLG